jgi:hypothetical protein
METNVDTVTINGVQYVRAGQQKPIGNRAVVVVDRGWIFAGDVTRANGRITLSRAVWVFKWDGVGFAAVVENPKKAKADIRQIADVEIPDGAEIFSVPVADSWGL